MRLPFKNTSSNTSSQKEGLDLFAPRWRSTRALAHQGYLYAVRVLKIIFPVLGLGLLGLLAIWPSFTDVTVKKFSPDLAQLQMIHPSYTGKDNNDRPYVMTAEKAVQTSQDPGLIDLVEPQAVMQAEDNSKIVLKARQGQLDRPHQKLHIWDQVTLQHEAGYHLTTADVYIMIDKGIAWSQTSVSGEAPSGEIQGLGFKLLDKGQTLLLTGPARLVIKSEK